MTEFNKYDHYDEVEDPMGDVVRAIARIRKIDGVLELVHDEIRAQDDKWGQQDHPILHGASGWMDLGEYQREARVWQRRNDYRVESGTLSWDGILLEEVYEALCETNPQALEVELIQVAAVAVQMVMALRRKAAEKAKQEWPQAEVDTDLRRVPPSYPVSTQYLPAEAKPTVAEAAIETMVDADPSDRPHGRSS